MLKYFKIIFSILLKTIFYNFTIFYIKRKIKPLFEIKKNKPNILILDHHRFKDDLIALYNTNEINLYFIDTLIQDRINIISEINFSYLFDVNFDFKNFNEFGYPNIYATETGKNYLRKFLINLLTKKKINCVLSCGYYYPRNINWEKALKNTKISFFCFHKESIGVSKKIDFLTNYPVYKKMRFFYGDRLFVGNNHVKDLLVKVDSRFGKIITVTGSPKIDNVIKHYNSLKENNTKIKKTITLFSFYHTYMLQDLTFTKGQWSPKKDFGFCKLFDSVHQTVAKFAANNPNVEVIIKIKWKDTIWLNHILSSFNKINLNHKLIKNLHFVDNIPAHKLIYESNTVIGFNSSVLAEALLLNKKTIIPIYFEALEVEEYKEYILWKDENVFSKVYSENDLYEQLLLFENQSDNYDNQDRSRVLNESFGYTDGNNAKRLYKNMLSFQ